MHYFFYGILFALYLAILAFDIRDVVVTVNRYGDPLFLQYSTTRTIPVDNKLDVAFSALYFVASIEVLLGSIWVLLTARKHGIAKRVGLLLIGLVGVPLFLRRVFFLAYGARFELSFNYYETWGAVLAETIITGFCAILVYAAIVLAAVQVDKARCKPWAEDQQREHGHPNGVAPQPAMQMYPDPTQGRYDVHEMQGQPNGHTRF
ncbi:hypothetical protein OEA41_000512 [Lepraria neglecta]|uniref:Uncharacterized protein n=1 Tax=Lepraria neglecta TaxID=209136 RepID=A0AAE0DPV9_9LECA|nr:hypothetical protein OEA41_000512 [Lepraria neglecta]